jgi:2-polyprenyl-6-methoxyphenol hydroxylase-like FAD-dependent oxidoreductase
VEFTQGEDGTVDAVVEDKIANHQYTIRARYLCGADGGNSKVANQLDLKFIEQPMGSLSLNIEIEADLGHLMSTAPGFLTTLTGDPAKQADREASVEEKEKPPFASVGLLRALKPWNEWTIILFCDPSIQRINASDDQIMTQIRELIDDDSVDIKIKGRHIWRIKDSVAEVYHKGNVFCLGDAVHRHPPHNGLGANTCIQDAYNLAWKLAMVLKARAGKALLDTYTNERQPVGMYVVRRANDIANVYFRLYGTLGLIGAPATERLRLDTLLKEQSAGGEALRDQIREIRRDLEEDYGGLGSEVNQWHQSTALYIRDETEGPAWPTESRERTMKYYESTFPGFKVPHVWLTKRKTMDGPAPGLISTRDLCGKGNFTLFTGIGGDRIWSAAVDDVQKQLGITIRLIGIGWNQEYEDTFFEWRKKREVSETGIILVRPDMTVAWRCKNGANEDDGKLLNVMKAILSLQ